MRKLVIEIDLGVVFAYFTEAVDLLPQIQQNLKGCDADHCEIIHPKYKVKITNDQTTQNKDSR